MGGISLVMNIAKDALLTQQSAMDVVSHNIANVSTDGYSRQISELKVKDPVPYAGFTFGSGVQLGDIVNTTNDFIEKRLQSATTDLSSMSEKETYMNIIETIFNESSDSSLSNQYNQFWSAWNDLNNNPSGIPERNMVTEYGSLLAQSFQDADNSLSGLNTELNNSIDSGVDAVNQLLDKIADINSQIPLTKTTGNPNDLIDQRNTLVKNLSEYLDVNTQESKDGNMTVTTNKGFTLVSRNDSYHLSFDGTDIQWENNSSPMTDNITGGKLGAWLDLRDATIPEYKSNLDELAKSTIWQINSLHSQGVGLSGFTSLTGSYNATDTSKAMGDSGIGFSDLFKGENFNLRLYDASGTFVGEETIPVDLNSTNMFTDLADTINNNSPPAILGKVNATVSNGVLSLNVNPGYTFTVANDSSYNLENMDISKDAGYKGSGLDFADKITNGSFKMWAYDDKGKAVGEATIPVDADTTSLSVLSDIINAASIDGTKYFNSSIKDGAISIGIDQSANPGYTFAFSDDSSNALAALGINTFFTASDARNIGINENILEDKNNIAAGKISNNIGDAIASASNKPSTTGFITTSEDTAAGYTGTVDGTFTIEINTVVPNGTFNWSNADGSQSGTGVPFVDGSTIPLADGVDITFNGAASDFNAGDKFTIDVKQSSNDNGAFFPGDNTNSLDISNLQYQDVSVKQWTYSRSEGTSSHDVTNSTLDDYLHQMIGTIGLDSQSVQREKDYTQTIHDQISQTRDNMSAVSLDEEMTDLIKYQHAYQAAAKLITTGQQMLDTIIQMIP